MWRERQRQRGCAAQEEKRPRVAPSKRQERSHGDRGRRACERRVCWKRSSVTTLGFLWFANGRLWVGGWLSARDRGRHADPGEVEIRPPMGARCDGSDSSIVDAFGSSPSAESIGHRTDRPTRRRVAHHISHFEGKTHTHAGGPRPLLRSSARHGTCETGDLWRARVTGGERRAPEASDRSRALEQVLQLIADAFFGKLRP